MFEAVEPVGVLEPDLEHGVAGEHQPVAARQNAGGVARREAPDMDAAAPTRSLTHIQANLDGDLSLEALAGAAGCSPPWFARRFAGMMAETPKQYTSRLRLERAALRLVLLDDGILDIALDCGFAATRRSAVLFAGASAVLETRAVSLPVSRRPVSSS